MFFMLPTVALVFTDRIQGNELSWWDRAVGKWTGYDLALPHGDMPNALLIHQNHDDEHWEEH